MKKINIIFLIYGLLITTTAFAGNHIAEKSSNRFISENKTSTNQSTVVQKKNNSKVEAVPEISFTFGDGMRGNWGRGWLDIYYSLNYDPKVPFKESDWICISNEVDVFVNSLMHIVALTFLSKLNFNLIALYFPLGSPFESSILL